MTNSSVPTDRPLERHELEQLVAQAIVRHRGTAPGSYFQPQEFATPYNLGLLSGLQERALQAFQTRNAGPEYSRYYDEFIHRLITLGVLVQTWQQPHAHMFVLTERGRRVLQDITQLPYFEAAQFIETLVDDELRQRCLDVLTRTKHPDSLVREATVVLEDRLRARINADVGVYGQALASQALRPNDGKLVLGETESERESLHRLFLGVMGFFGNPTHHRLLPDLPVIRARQIVGTIDTLLGLLREAKDRT